MAKRDDTVRRISVATIKPSPWQQRKFGPQTKEGIEELAASIKHSTLLQPIVVRTVAGGYELVAGERRLRATKHNKAKRIKALVLELSDADAEELHAVENLQRVDLHPLEEAFTLRGMLDREGATVQKVATRVGVSIGYVSRRARLTTLTPKWLKLLQDPKHEVHKKWTGSHFEAVARIAPDSQDKLLAEGARHPHWFWSLGLEGLERQVGDMLHELKRAPWKLDDAELVETAGPCTLCPHRASQEPGLFDDMPLTKVGDTVVIPTKIPRGDRCLNGACWDKKRTAHVRQVIAAKVEAFGEGKVLLVRDYSPQAVTGKIKGCAKPVESWEYTSCKKSTPGARPGVKISGPSAGAFGYYKKAQSISRHKPTAAEERVRLLRKRHNVAIEQANEELAKVKGSLLPDLETLVVISQADYYDRPEVLRALLKSKKPTKAQVNDAIAELWERNGSVGGVYTGDGSDEWRAASDMLKLVGLNPRPLLLAAKKEHPDPPKPKAKKAPAKKKPAAKKTAKKKAS